MSVLRELKQGYFIKEWLENVPSLKYVNEWVSKVRKVRHEYIFYSTASSSKTKIKREGTTWIYSQIIKRELKDGSFKFTFSQTTKLPGIQWKGTFMRWLPGLEIIEFPENCIELGFKLDGNSVPHDTDDFQYHTLDEAIEACLKREDNHKQNLSKRDDGQRF